MKKNWLKSIILCLGLLLIGDFYFYPKIGHSESPTFIVERDVCLNKDSILLFLTENGAICPSMGCSQVLLESGHFKSRLVKENHNIAGIRNSHRKYSRGIKNGYNDYGSYKLCLLDLIAVQKAYAKAIDRHYAEDPGYINKLKKIK
jgi:flagellum-specific peptidoglycan hydrolase FlgJ